MSGGTGGVEALDAAGADPSADRHPADDTQAGAQQGRHADRRCSEPLTVRHHGALRAQARTRILYMGDLMVHKVMKKVRAGRESRSGEPKACLHGTATAAPPAQRRTRTARHKSP